jgi:hypothetical protein
VHFPPAWGAILRLPSSLGAPLTQFDVVPNAQYQRCDDSDCGCSLPPRCAVDVPTTIAVAAIWENHAHGNARLLLLSRVCPADQCGMARETKVTVAWPSRNILRPKSPAQRALITALPAYASEYQVGILVKCPPATSSHSPSQPPLPFADYHCCPQSTPPPAIRHPYVACLPCLSGGHCAPPLARRRIYLGTLCLADTTFSYILTRRTTMLQSRLRHRSSNATGPPEISVLYRSSAPVGLCKSDIYACKRPIVHILVPLSPSINPPFVTPCPAYR